MMYLLLRILYFEIYLDNICVSDWYLVFNAVFLLSLGTIVCVGVGVLLKKFCSVCGLGYYSYFVAVEISKSVAR